MVVNNTWLVLGFTVTTILTSLRDTLEILPPVSMPLIYKTKGSFVISLLTVSTSLFFFSFILLLIAQQYKADDKLPSKELGISLVNALYSYDSLEDLYERQSKELLKIMPENLMYRYSIEYNQNRIQYTYYGLEEGKVSPNIHKALEGYVEFSVFVNGEDDNILRGIWYAEENGMISGVSEALLYPFPTNQEEGVSNEK